MTDSSRTTTMPQSVAISRAGTLATITDLARTLASLQHAVNADAPHNGYPSRDTVQPGTGEDLTEAEIGAIHRIALEMSTELSRLASGHRRLITCVLCGRQGRDSTVYTGAGRKGDGLRCGPSAAGGCREREHDR